MNRERILEGCLVESDPATAARARKMKRGALLIAVVLQVALVTLLILAPLLGAVEKLPWALRWEPIPPYRGSLHPAAPKGDARPGGPKKIKFTDKRGIIFPGTVPPKVDMTPDAAAPETPEESGPWIEVPGDPRGLLPPIGDPRAGRPNPPAELAPRPPQEKPIIVSPPIQEARLIRRVEPKYPMIAARAGLEGKVVLRAVIGRDGTMKSLEVLSGNPLFVRESVEAIGQWRYQPTLLGGKPVEVETMITVIFTLRR